RAWAGAGSAPLDASLRLDRETGDGQLHAGARDADLAAWSRWLHVAGVVPESGHGRLEAWATLRGHRVDGFVVDTALERVRLAGAPLRDARGLVTVPRMGFASIDARARWQRVEGGWRLDAPRLRLPPGDAAIGSGPQVLDGLLVAGGTRWALAGPRIEIGPLLAIAALGEGLSPGLRRWLLDARPRVRLEGAEFAARDGLARGQARLVDARFAPAGDAPGLSGLSGTLSGDGRGFVFVPDRQSSVVFDWPRGFGTAHAFALDGQVAGWRDGAAWRVATDALSLDGAGIGIAVRGGLAWEGDGTRPR